MLSQLTVRRGSRCSTAKAFLRPVRLRPNLHIALRAQALRVLIDPGNNPNAKSSGGGSSSGSSSGSSGAIPFAYGVQFMRGNRKQTVRVRREVRGSTPHCTQTPTLLRKVL